MHQTRALVNKRVPIPRKGTTYVVRTRDHPGISVSVLTAMRDMLHLANTQREVRHLIHTKKLKINGELVRDHRQPIRLFSIFEADKKYKLIFSETASFELVETKDTTRIAKVIGKRLLRDGKIQITLHDGTNLIGKKDSTVGDSVVLSMANKIEEVKPIKKGAHAIILDGKNTGKQGTIKEAGETIMISIGGREVALERKHVIVV